MRGGLLGARNKELHVLSVANPVTLEKCDGGVIRGRALSDDTKNLAAKVIDVFDLRLGIDGKSIGREPDADIREIGSAQDGANDGSACECDRHIPGDQRMGEDRAACDVNRFYIDAYCWSRWFSAITQSGIEPPLN